MMVLVVNGGRPCDESRQESEYEACYSRCLQLSDVMWPCHVMSDSSRSQNVGTRLSDPNAM